MKKVAGRRDKYPERVHQSRFTVAHDPNQGWRCSVSELKEAYGSAKYHLNYPTLSNSLNVQNNTEMSLFSRVGKNISYFTRKTRGQLRHQGPLTAAHRSHSSALHKHYTSFLIDALAVDNQNDWTGLDQTGLEWTGPDWTATVLQ